MRKPLIAGNWKMNTHLDTALDLAKCIHEGLSPESKPDVLICPPSIYLQPVSALLQASQSSVFLGAQNVYDQPAGAFTGEISTKMLTDISCQFVILGHSERRHVMGETDQQVNAKALAALEAGLTPIICLGETLEQRENGQTLSVVQEQFKGSMANFTDDQVSRSIIAYEPVWAIGTGKVATPEQAQDVHADLRKTIKTHYNQTVSDSVRLLYGGSVKPENAAELLNQDDIDGALVGGASLKAESFMGIINSL